jgi:hypothetical protein
LILLGGALMSGAVCLALGTFGGGTFLGLLIASWSASVLAKGLAMAGVYVGFSVGVVGGAASFFKGARAVRESLMPVEEQDRPFEPATL